LRLWLRLTLAMAVVALLPLVVTGALALRTATADAESTSQTYQRRSAALRADFVGVWVQGQLGFLAGWRDVYAGRLAGLAPRLQRGFLESVYRSNRTVVAVALVGLDGEPVVEPVWLDDPPDGWTASSSERVAQMLALAPMEAVANGAPAAFGPLYVPAADGPASVTVAVLAADGPPRDDGRPAWLVLVAEITLDQVVGALEANSSPTAGMALLDGSGVPRFGGDHPLVQPELIRALAGTTSMFSYDLEDGQAVYGETAPVPQTDWTVVVAQPESVVFAAVDSIRDTLQAMVAASMLLALALGLGLAQTMAAPLGRLRDSVLEVAGGRFGQQVPTTGGGELTELAVAFNEMSTALHTAQGEVEQKQARIEAFNVELQDRVDERTAELRRAQGELVRSGQLAAVAEVGAGLAHELNNPLAGILGLTQVLRTRHAEGLDAALLSDIEGQAQRCRDVVEAMQRFADADVDPASDGVVDLRAVLTEVEALVSGPFRQRGVILQVIQAEEPLPIRVELVHGARLFAQVLQTLRAGLSDGTTLTVRPHRVDARAVVDLETDREPGESLSRVDDQRAAGLGLWVARQLVARQGGSLDQRDGQQGWRLALPLALEAEA
jgi:two-component system NtrC family sensor kinase